MMEDPSDDLLQGLWPIAKRLIMVLLPMWVFLLLYVAKVPVIFASIIAGLSLAPVVMYEKLALKKRFTEENT